MSLLDGLPAGVVLVKAGVVQIYDVKDVWRFVHNSIRKSKIKIKIGSDEYEELVAEGVALLVRLAMMYKPQMEGYAQEGSFAGYCARYLPPKISRAWHQMHPEHVRRLVDGKLVYEYGEAPVSLEITVRTEGEDVTLVEALGERTRVVGDFTR